MKALVNKELKSLFCSTYIFEQKIFLLIISFTILNGCNTSSKNKEEYKLSQYTKNSIGELDKSIEITFIVNNSIFDNFISALDKLESKANIKKEIGKPRLTLSDGNKYLEVELSETNLEYTVIKYLKLLQQDDVKDIAFIDGHGELPQVELLDAEELLSQEYNVHRGEIGDRVGVLDGFSAIIIAGPKKPFSENEKYVLDQYIMQGGKILWLLDGIYISEDYLKIKGWSASIKNETNLDDILYNYGARVKPQLIQDQQCSNIQLVSGELSELITVPNIYAPLLDLSYMQNIITDKLSTLSLLFASPIDSATNIPSINKHIILHSSKNTFLVDPPERIDFYGDAIETPTEHFNKAHVPIGIILEGEFQSFFASSSSSPTEKHLYKSSTNKMIVIGSSSIIRNGIQGQNETTKTLPMGYNRANSFLADNREFILNAVNWLTEDDVLLSLKDISKAKDK